MYVAFAAYILRLPSLLLLFTSQDVDIFFFPFLGSWED
jgi:hypothetical protein